MSTKHSGTALILTGAYIAYTQGINRFLLRERVWQEGNSREREGEQKEGGRGEQREGGREGRWTPSWVEGRVLWGHVTLQLDHVIPV